VPAPGMMDYSPNQGFTSLTSSVHLGRALGCRCCCLPTNALQSEHISRFGSATHKHRTVLPEQAGSWKLVISGDTWAPAESDRHLCPAPGRTADRGTAPRRYLEHPCPSQQSN